MARWGHTAGCPSLLAAWGGCLQTAALKKCPFLLKSNGSLTTTFHLSGLGWKEITNAYILAVKEEAEAGLALALQGNTVALAWGFACRRLKGVLCSFRCKAEPLVCAAWAAVPGHVRVGPQRGINVQPVGTGRQ